MEQSNDFIMNIKIQKCFDEYRKHFLKFEFYPNKLTILQAKKISDAYNQYFFQKHNKPIKRNFEYENNIVKEEISFFKDKYDKHTFLKNIPICVAEKGNGKKKPIMELRTVNQQEVDTALRVVQTCIDCGFKVNYKTNTNKLLNKTNINSLLEKTNIKEVKLPENNAENNINNSSSWVKSCFNCCDKNTNNLIKGKIYDLNEYNIELYPRSQEF